MSIEDAVAKRVKEYAMDKLRGQSAKLEPCPFCASDETSHGYESPPERGVAQCHSCGAFLVVDAMESSDAEAEAIVRWNRRDEHHKGPTAMARISRDRVIEMLNNFANGTYQAIDPGVCATAAIYLQRSVPLAEDAAAESKLALNERPEGTSNSPLPDAPKQGDDKSDIVAELKAALFELLEADRAIHDYETGEQEARNPQALYERMDNARIAASNLLCKP